jgi:hypothetical protein
MDSNFLLKDAYPLIEGSVTYSLWIILVMHIQTVQWLVTILFPLSPENFPDGGGQRNPI